MSRNGVASLRPPRTTMIRPRCSTTNSRRRSPGGWATYTGASKPPIRTSRTPRRACAARAVEVVAVGDAPSPLVVAVARVAVDPAARSGAPSEPHAAMTRPRTSPAAAARRVMVQEDVRGTRSDAPLSFPALRGARRVTHRHRPVHLVGDLPVGERSGAAEQAVDDRGG